MERFFQFINWISIHLSPLAAFMHKLENKELYMLLGNRTQVVGSFLAYNTRTTIGKSAVSLVVMP
jgi:hypothetical protein